MNSTADSWLSATNHGALASPVKTVLANMALKDDTDFPSPQRLLNVASHLHRGLWPGPAFKAQSAFSEAETRYYEQIIFEDNVVPTREVNWHDFFNALIWIQFPRTKSLLNRLHMDDISVYGAHPRTPCRNRITHFDECGVVIAVPDDQAVSGTEMLERLAYHQWRSVLFNDRTRWGTILHPMIFGHANLEMLLNPFEGLTGKWLAVRVPSDFSERAAPAQWAAVDEALYHRLSNDPVFSQKGHLHPLPLLGVPGWHDIQDENFYLNEKYFRPLTKQKPVGTLLP